MKTRDLEVLKTRDMEVLKSQLVSKDTEISILKDLIRSSQSIL